MFLFESKFIFGRGAVQLIEMYVYTKHCNYLQHFYHTGPFDEIRSTKNAYSFFSSGSAFFDSTLRLVREFYNDDGCAILAEITSIAHRSRRTAVKCTTDACKNILICHYQCSITILLFVTERQLMLFAILLHSVVKTCRLRLRCMQIDIGRKPFHGNKTFVTLNFNIF